MTNNSFLKKLIKNLEDTTIAEDGASSAEYDGYIDTGSYILNGQIFGSLLGGHPNNKVLTLAGEQGVGKTFLALSIGKHFLNNNPDALCIWYLAEPAVTKQMLVERGIDSSRVAFPEPDTVQDWTYNLVAILDNYIAAEKQPPLIVVLDSLGALSTSKELVDVTNKDDVRDFTKAPMIKRAFRIIDKKLARAKVPLIVTNHTYSTMDQYKPREMSGGSGLKYAGDVILWLSAYKDKVGEGKEAYVQGVTIKSFAWKNRFARQFSTVEIGLSFNTGLDRYHGLPDLALRQGVIKKRQAGAKGNIYTLPNGKELKLKDFKPEVWDNLLPQLDEAAKREFQYGQGLSYADDNAGVEPANS